MRQKNLRDCAEKIDVGFVGNMVDEYTEDISTPILLQTKNIFEFEVNLNDVVHINEKFHQRLKKSQIHREDVLLARSGSFGKASIWLKDFVANSADIIIVKTRREYLGPYYLVSFLNSLYGREQLFRFSSGGLQGHVNLTILENLIVPEMTITFQDELKKIVQAAFNLSERADENYHAAEKILSATLGLDDFSPSQENVAIKTFSVSFGISGRLDAEFYRYVEIGDVNVSNGFATANAVATDDLPDNAKIMTKAGDILVSKVRPNRGAVAILRENDLLVSGAFAVLRSNGNFSDEVLQVLLRTEIYRDFMLKYNVGTSYPVIKDEDVLNLPLPVVSREVQEKIAAQVSESFRLRSESEKLLARAKRAVELAIEQDEDAAIKF